MKNTIKCKFCGKEIEISEALRHDFEEQFGVEEREKGYPGGCATPSFRSR